jgi:hypothetical protein
MKKRPETNIPKKKWKVKHHRFTESVFQPYTLAIGQLNLAWNDLHEKLALLFWTVMGGGFSDLAMGLWHSVTLDRPKRELLRAAVNAKTEHERYDYPKMIDEIFWLLDKAEALEQDRNNSIHSPLFYGGTLSDWIHGNVGVIPDTMLGNKRAKNLAKKVDAGLLEEFRRCRDTALILRDYAYVLKDALSLSGQSRAWPKRPSLPILKVKKTIPKAQPRVRVLSQPPPPRSSRG